MTAHFIIWAVVALAIVGVISRPWRLPEAVWAVSGAAALVLLGLLPWRVALQGIGQGTDVYLFLAGMMLLAELARREGLFDWLAAYAARLARGSASRLFTLIYLAGTLVTVFLSNDATAVVLTPAVAAITQAAGAKQPLPYLLICAFIANAASFVLPISNPANLVIYGNHIPPLLQWLPRFALPSAVSIIATYILLRFTQREALQQQIASAIEMPALSIGGKTSAAGIAFAAAELMLASAFGYHLGLPAFLAGLLTAAAVLLAQREMRWQGISQITREISWGVLPLVAGLFVLVAALGQTGILDLLSNGLRYLLHQSPRITVWAAGIGLGIGSNLMNNLPAGLIAGHAVMAAQLPPRITSAVLLGVDIGPNLSVTGSLATILWLAALRREGQHITAWNFLKLGIVIMPPALILAVLALFA